ncbi:hypothetical protein ACFLZY_01245, partial [Patescibacteria group bacterium]
DSVECAQKVGAKMYQQGQEQEASAKGGHASGGESTQQGEEQKKEDEPIEAEFEEKTPDSGTDSEQK